MALKTISDAELVQHNKPGDAWVAVDGDVYNVSKFASLHPGGAKVLEQLAGNDVTTEFYELHRHDVLAKYARLRVGRLASAKKAEAGIGISAIPFAELPAFQGQQSPYFGESHRRFAEGCREFVMKELMPIAAERDLRGEYPDEELREKLGANGMLVSRMGPGPWMKDAAANGIGLPGGVKHDEFDYFHEMIAHQEISRIGLPGFIDGLGAGWLISVPAIYNFASEDMKRAIGPDLLAGKKWSALAISEPFAGSDVASLKTIGVKTPDGQHYVVNGVKKWITEGMYADYFVTAVRTGKGGAAGISMMLIDRAAGGVDTSQIKTTYSTCAGTALVILDDAKVPVSNVFGEENSGFAKIMYNFNHERWMIANSLIGQARAAVTDSFMWARQRKIFGKQLIDQPVIRNKLATAVAALESVQAYNEAITYDMKMSKDGALGQRLAGPIALLKYQTTRMAWLVADNAVQILGGRGITRTGMGARVEGLKNFAKYAAVYGGSEEIMADLAIKQALKGFPQEAKL